MGNIHKTKPFCVYRIEYDDGRIIHNYGKLASAFKDDYGFYTVSLMSEHDAMADAKSAFTRLTQEPILCHQTGTIYDTVNMAAVDCKIHPQSLLAHLAGRPGYEAPRGFTFQRIPREIA